MKKIGIIVLNWNNYKETKQCLDSILNYQFTEINVQIYLVDNNSNDNSGSLLNSEYKNKVNYWNTGRNSGYTGGNNYGIMKAKEDNCDIFIVLNNDLIITNFKELVYSVVKVFSVDTKIGILGFNTYNYKTKSLMKSKGFSDLLFNSLMKISKDIQNIDNEFNISYERSVCGCAIAFSSNCIESIGLFDESFFMYGEEQDICLRAILKNWDVVRINSDKFFIFRKVDPVSSKQLIWEYGPRNIFYSYRKNLKGWIKYIFILWQIIIYSKNIVFHFSNKRFKISQKIIKSMLNGLFGKLS